MSDKVIVHNGIKVIYTEWDRYCLYWCDDDGQNMEYICNVYGFENAVRVANGIAHEQVEWVTTPPFRSEWEERNSAA